MKCKLNILFFYALVICIFIKLQPLSAQKKSELVFLKKNSLHYTSFAMEGQENKVNIIPDFSYAGYKGGGVKLPFVSTLIELESIDGDNYQQIQNAIQTLEKLPLKNGFRGAILLKKGIYKISNTLKINKSGIVIRGEGQGENGTILIGTNRKKQALILIESPKSVSNFLREKKETTQRITSFYIPVGSYQLQIQNASKFNIGDTISIQKTPNLKWIQAIGMHESELCKGAKEKNRKCYGWEKNGEVNKSYFLKYERIITKIHKNSITINIPMVDVIEKRFGGGTVSKAKWSDRIYNCGVENLRIEDIDKTTITQNRIWQAIQLTKVVNCWVDGVTSKYVGYSCVSIKKSNFNTIQNSACLDLKSPIQGGNRYSFNISSGLGNLFQRCYTRAGRHDFVTGARVTGPNVFVDCLAESTKSDIGPHHRWAVGTLYDNINGGAIRVRNRTYLGTGHGWSGAQILFWNVNASEDITTESPFGAKNWAIGSHAKSYEGNGFFEHKNNTVTPRSIYYKQLEERLGTKALDNVIITDQKSGNIYNLLQEWAGKGCLENKKK